MSGSPYARSREEDRAASNGASDASAAPGVESVPAQFQELVWDLEKIGLRNWLKMGVQDLAAGSRRRRPCRGVVIEDSSCDGPLAGSSPTSLPLL